MRTAIKLPLTKQFALVTAMMGVLAVNHSVRAATDTWQGNSSALFSGLNWTGGNNPPVTGDALVFGVAGSSGTSLTADQGTITYAGITFNSGASAFTIGGSGTTTLTGNIVNNSTSLQTINFNMTSTAVRTYTTTAGGGDIALGGNLTGSGGGIIKAGSGTLSLSGVNTFNSITVNAGTLSLTGGSTTINVVGNPNFFIGSASTTATVLLSGSASLTSTVNNSFTRLGTGNNGIGILNLSTANNTVNIGNFGVAMGNTGTSSAGVIYNSGSFMSSGGGLYMGNADNAYAYFNNSGTATFNANLNVSHNDSTTVNGAAAVLDVTGGTVTVSSGNNFKMNDQNRSYSTASGGAEVNVTGGTLQLNTAATVVQLNQGGNNYSSMNITGSGKVASATTSGFELAVNSSSSAFTTLSLYNGGELDTAYINKAGTSSSGILTFNNGKLKATAADATALIRNNVAAYVQSGGGTIDNGGNNVTIASALLSPSGNGVTSISLGGTTSGYIGAPVVKITGGGGTGAAAIATFDPATGTITGITVTSPGSGYTSVPTVTLQGGSGTPGTGAGAGTATATASIGAVSSGGVTFTATGGTGTTTLSGANTYTGNTVVSSGTLLVNSPGSLASGSAVSVSGSVLGGSGTVSGATTISSSGALTPRPGGGSATTLTFGGNLSLSSASANFTLSTTAAGANDKVNFGSTLTLNNTDTINITGTPLDVTTDYTLFTSTGGTVSMATPPTLKINGVTSDQTSTGKYQLLISGDGHSLLLHYIAAATPPTVNSASASPTSLGHYQTTTLTVNVTPAAGKSITSVTVSVDGLAGAGDPVTLTGPGGDGTGNWTGTFKAGGNTAAGSYTISGAVNQSDGGVAAWSVTGITVTNASPVWGGGGSDNKWSTLANWNSGSGPAPGTGDGVAFAGSTQVTNNLDHSVSIVSLTFNSGAGSFDITNAANTLTLTAGLTNNSANAQTLDVPVALSGAQTINAASGNVAFSRAVSDSGAGFTLAGSGMLTLSAVNTYSGATTISGGLLTITNSGSLGSGSYSANITNNGALNYGSSANQTLSGVISGTGSLTNSGSGTLTLNGANTYSGGTTLNAGTLSVGASSTPTSGTVTSGPLGTGTLTLNGGTFNFTGVSTFTLANNVNVTGATSIQVAPGVNEVLNGNFSGNGNLTLLPNQNSTGQWMFGGDNSGYTGTFTQNGGATSVSFNSANSGSASAVWAFNNNVNQRTRLSFGDGTISFGSLSGNGSIANVAASGAATVSVGALNASTTFSGVLGGSTSGQGQNISLLKVGTGALTLSGVNTYTGNTTISGGTLLVNGSTASGSAVTVAGGTLGGTGTVGGAVTVNSGGTLAPGAFIGTLTLGSLTLNSGATTAIELGDSLSGDKAAATGAVVYGGTLKLIWTGTTPTTGAVDLFDGSGFSGAFSSLQLSNWPSAFRVNTNNLTTDGSISIAANASPVAQNLIAGVVQGGVLTLPVIGGKHGATDADGDTLTITAVSAATSGTSGTNGNSVTYAATGTTGTNTFTYTVSDAFGASDTKTVTVVVSNPQGFNQVSAGVYGGNAVMTYLGIPGTNYALEITHNLPATNWTPVITNPAAVNGSLNFTNPISLSPTNDYYRTRYVP